MLRMGSEDHVPECSRWVLVAIELLPQHLQLIGRDVSKGLTVLYEKSVLQSEKV